METGLIQGRAIDGRSEMFQADAGTMITIGRQVLVADDGRRRLDVVAQLVGQRRFRLQRTDDGRFEDRRDRQMRSRTVEGLHVAEAGLVAGVEHRGFQRLGEAVVVDRRSDAVAGSSLVQGALVDRDHDLIRRNIERQAFGHGRRRSGECAERHHESGSQETTTESRFPFHGFSFHFSGCQCTETPRREI